MTLFADSYAMPDLAVLRADGYGGVVRYATHGPNCITVAEAQTERAAGFEVLLVFEDLATNALGGYTQGETDARFANSVADSIGYPAGCPIFYAVDFDAQSGQLAVIEDYFAGVLSVRARPSGPYGSVTVVNAVMQAGLGTYAWQTLAWSGGQVTNRAVLYQSTPGTAWDTDEQLGFIPAWGAAPTTPPSPPKGPSVAQLARPIIAIVGRPQNDGYWIVAQDGGVFNFGAAPDLGSEAKLELQPGHLVVDAKCTATGEGLWLAASDGEGVYCLGDATFHGNLSGLVTPSSQPIEA